MDRLRTTPMQLRLMGGKLQAQGEKIGDIVERMINLVNSMSATTWSGQAASAYKEKFDELNNDAKNMRELLNNIQEKLDNIANTYEQAEEANTSLANSLPIDIF